MNKYVHQLFSKVVFETKLDYTKEDLDKLIKDSTELVETAKGVYVKAKDDKKFLDIYEKARDLRNVIRTHVRNNYPEEYKKSVGMNEGASINEAAPIIVIYKGRRLVVEPEEFKRLKLGKDIVGMSSKYPGQEEWILAKGDWSIEEMSMSGGAGAYSTPYAFKLTKKQKSI